MVEVQDGGAVPGWRPAPGAGLGLAGLRERLAVLGGRLETASATGGFKLHAVIPDRSAQPYGPRAQLVIVAYEAGLVAPGSGDR